MTRREVVRKTWLTAVFLLAGAAWSPAAGIESSWGVAALTAGKIVNSLILFGGLAYLLHKPIKMFIASRTGEIRKKLAEAELARADAEAQLEELKRRLLHMDDEILAMKEQAKTDARAEQLKVVEAAEKEADRIRARAEVEIDSLKKQAMEEMRHFAAERAAETAEAIVRKEIRPEDEAVLFREFVGQVGGSR